MDNQASQSTQSLTTHLNKPFPTTSIVPTLNIIFVLGGPGAGKGTVCSRLAQKFKLQHLSVGDVLRAERKLLDSEYAEIIAKNMRLGTVGPKEVTIKLLRKAIDRAIFLEGITTFLIDGFPRKMDQLHLFEEVVCPATTTILLQCSANVRRQRLLQRDASDRYDDDLETITRRFETFDKTTSLVIEHLDHGGRLIRINADRAIDSVFEDAQICLKDFTLEAKNGMKV